MRMGSMPFCIEKLHPLAGGDARFWTMPSASYTAHINQWGYFFFLVSLQHYSELKS